MIIFSAILFFLLSAVIHFGIFLFISPTLLGFFIAVIINAISFKLRNKRAPILWDIITAGFIIYSTILLTNDVIYEEIDYSSKPIAILLYYGLASVFLLAFLALIERKVKKKVFAPKTVISANDSFAEIEENFYDEALFSQSFPDLSQLRQNITVSDTVLKKYDLTFKHHLIADCDILQLNFELNITKEGLSRFPRYNELTIKVNAYDKKGNLLCIEETGIDYSDLKSGYFADFFYLSNVSTPEVNSLKIYAIDPAEENEEDDVSFDFTSNEDVVSELNNMLNKSLELLQTTVYPKTYFSRYQIALDNAKKIAETAHIEVHKTFALDIIKDLTENKPQKIKEFIDRCYSKGNLYSIKDELLSGKYDLPDEVKTYIESLICKIETENTDLPESGEYIYCSISLDATGKTYYYKTTDETLKCGDEVIVKVGKEGKKVIAKIVKIERFPIGKTPYPPSLTKEILSKCP